eukprot:TRINITY_DN47080_c0_g1_i2.p1 TRINITY_DN47080_c0_g1~~TRINITY_DN47080_c0_g1_i2.p1  ORF type:complete len:237 (+),score=44.24 TRINITY_DN47080_c0_g1_i2:274-984(+)
MAASSSTARSRACSGRGSFASSSAASASSSTHNDNTGVSFSSAGSSSHAATAGHNVNSYSGSWSYACSSKRSRVDEEVAEVAKLREKVAKMGRQLQLAQSALKLGLSDAAAPNPGDEIRANGTKEAHIDVARFVRALRESQQQDKRVDGVADWTTRLAAMLKQHNDLVDGYNALQEAARDLVASWADGSVAVGCGNNDKARQLREVTMRSSMRAPSQSVRSVHDFDWLEAVLDKAT